MSGKHERAPASSNHYALDAAEKSGVAGEPPAFQSRPQNLLVDLTAN